MPKCEKCPSAPEMIRVGVTDLIDLSSDSGGAGMAKGHAMYASGHPLMWALYTAGKGLGWVANQFWEEHKYKCPNCDFTKSETKSK